MILYLTGFREIAIATAFITFYHEAHLAHPALYDN